LTHGNARLKKGKKAPGEKLPVLIPNPDLFWMLPRRVVKKSRLPVETIRRTRGDRTFEFQKGRQLFSRVHSELLCVAAICVSITKFIFAGHVKRLHSSECSADVAKWQTQRT
jgi:hypothetical protein